MSDDPPPPYTAKDETKMNEALQPTTFVSFIPQDVQILPSQLIPSAPGYETVAYYPACSSTSATVPLQPQQRQQVVVIQSPQVFVVPPGHAEAQQQRPATRSFAGHICLSCCSVLCCWSCPCSLIAFMLAGKFRTTTPIIILWSRHSQQRERLSASTLSICSSVCLFVCPSVAKMQKRDFLKN